MDFCSYEHCTKAQLEGEPVRVEPAEAAERAALAKTLAEKHVVRSRYADADAADRPSSNMSVAR